MEHFAGLSYGKNTGHRILYICIKIVIFALKKELSLTTTQNQC